VSVPRARPLSSKIIDPVSVNPSGVVADETLAWSAARPPGSRWVTSAALAIALSGPPLLPPPDATTMATIAMTTTATPAPIQRRPRKRRDAWPSTPAVFS
jgi:hypothetical protein